MHSLCLDFYVLFGPAHQYYREIRTTIVPTQSGLARFNHSCNFGMSVTSITQVTHFHLTLHYELTNNGI
jgi:hypothetical protein